MRDLPGSLADLENLSNLFFRKNHMNNVTILDGFQDLTSVRELCFDAIQLQGKFLTWIGDLSDLKLLDLRSKVLTGSLKVNLSKLDKLTYLMLSDNTLTGLVPEDLGSLNKLRKYVHLVSFFC
jgi:Leucine-rich repeat (LRR) protein